MDRSPATFQLGGRSPASPAFGRAGAPASFDPSVVPPGATKSAHAKEYGSSFSEGFLRYLRSGDLADVVVEVIAEDTSAAQTTAPELLKAGSITCGSHKSHDAITNPDPAPASPSPSASSSLCSSFACLPYPNLTPFVATTFDARPVTGIGEYRLHGLLLARHSAFFAAALGQDNFADSAARRIRLTLDPATAPAWPILVDYFYTDRVRLDKLNALPLLALARQLLVPELDAYCTDYICGRLCASNCLAHLRAAVRFTLHDLHAECVALAAQGFPLLYSSNLSGLPPTSLLEILTHPMLQVHCELQVVEAITRYLATTAVDTEAKRALCSQIRFPYLDNATITRLAIEPGLVLVTSRHIPSDVDVTTESPSEVAVEPTAAPVVIDGTDGPSQHVEGSSGAMTAVAAAGSASCTASGPAEAVPDMPAASASSATGSAAAATVAPTTTSGDDGAGGSASGGGNGALKAVANDKESASSGEGAAAAATAAAAADGDSDLLSAGSSECSTPTSTSGAVAGTSLSCASRPHPHMHRHHEQLPQQQHSKRLGDGKGECSATAAPLDGGSDELSPTLHRHHNPQLPRDMALEGALARLAAIEFSNLLPAGKERPYQQRPAAAASGAGGPNAGGQQPLSFDLDQYLQYRPQRNYGGGAVAGSDAEGAVAAGQAAAAAGGGGGRRLLAVFRGHGAPPPTPPAALTHHQQLLMAQGLYDSPPPAAAPGATQHQQAPNSVHPSLQGARDATEHGADGTHASRYGRRQQVTAGAGAAAGGAITDMAAAFAAFCLPPPRLSYCSNVVHGLPGGCAWVDVALETIWEHLMPYITVQVSGCGEGNPRNVVVSDPDCFFETNDSSDPLPWLELQLPHNVHMLQLQRYTFLHGHRRAGYYRARNFKTQIAVRPASEIRGREAEGCGRGGATGNATAATTSGTATASQRHGSHGQGTGRGGPAGSTAASAASGPPACRYVDVATRMTEQFDVIALAGATALGPWRVLRLQAAGAQEDGVHRLCVRGLRMYGIARVNLMQQAYGFAVQPPWILNARVELAGSGASGTAAMAGSSGSGGGGGGSASSGYGYGGAAPISAGGGGALGGGNLQQWLV